MHSGITWYFPLKLETVSSTTEKWKTAAWHWFMTFNIFPYAAVFPALSSQRLLFQNVCNFGRQLHNSMQTTKVVILRNTHFVFCNRGYFIRTHNSETDCLQNKTFLHLFVFVFGFHRFMMVRIVHQDSWAISQKTTCLMPSSTARPTISGWSLTAMVPVPAKDSSYHTVVSWTKCQ